MASDCNKGCRPGSHPLIDLFSRGTVAWLLQFAASRRQSPSALHGLGVHHRPPRRRVCTLALISSHPWEFAVLHPKPDPCDGLMLCRPSCSTSNQVCRNLPPPPREQVLRSESARALVLLLPVVCPRNAEFPARRRSSPARLFRRGGGRAAFSSKKRAIFALSALGNIQCGRGKGGRRMCLSHTLPWARRSAPSPLPISRTGSARSLLSRYLLRALASMVFPPSRHEQRRR